VARIRTASDVPDGARPLFEALRELHTAAGQPSMREIARRAGKLSHDTVHRTLIGPAVPSSTALTAVVEALGGDREEFLGLWRSAAEPEAVPRAGDRAIRVMLVDDHEVVRMGLAELLDREGLEVVAQAADGQEAVERVAAVHPDVVIMDVRMPRMSGVEATARIRAAHPEIAILVLTSYEDPETERAAMDAGASEYLLKQIRGTELVAKVRRLGEAAPGHRPAPIVAPDIEGTLTEREREVMALVAHGLTNSQIAQRLQLSVRTVANHVQRIYYKLGVSNRATLTRLAVQRGTDRIQRDG
jgi:two-component system response regulator DevR